MRIIVDKPLWTFEENKYKNSHFIVYGKKKPRKSTHTHTIIHKYKYRWAHLSLCIGYNTNPNDGKHYATHMQRKNFLKKKPNWTRRKIEEEEEEEKQQDTARQNHSKVICIYIM